MSATTIYEYPFNETMRHLLRLEHYFDQISKMTNSTGTTETPALIALANLIEILNLLERNDIRSEIIEQIKSQLAFLSTLAKNPHIDKSMLTETKGTLATHLEKIRTLPGRTPKRLKQDPFLAEIQKKLNRSGLACVLDSPRLQYWLGLSKELKTLSMQNWLNEIAYLQNTLSYLLSLTRSSALFQQNIAKTGSFQQSLTHLSCQLLRLKIENDLGIYPEISAGKHYLSVRFFKEETGDSPKIMPTQSKEEIPFEVCYCGM